MQQIFFDNWESILRSFVITMLAYAGLVLFTRISGKRTLSKMNAYDFVITVALGSALATVALNKNVALVDGLLVFALLITLQVIVSKLSLKYSSVRELVTSTPTVLYFQGHFISKALKKERISKEDVYSAIRSQGISHLDKVGVVLLESTGDLVVLGKPVSASDEVMSDVEYKQPNAG